MLGLLVLCPAARALPMTGPDVPEFAAYDRTIPALLDKWHIPGASVAVAYQGRIVFARGYGYADRDTGRLVQPDTSFRIMSISKILTATMIMKLVEQGDLSLDDHPFDILNYRLPTYAGARPDPRMSQITVRHLLSHTSGWVADQASNPIVGGRGFSAILYQQQIARIMGEPAPGTAETMIRYMMGQPMQAAPGTTWSYCNVGYLILGRLIEVKTGLSYTAAIQRLVEPSFLSGLLPAGSRQSELAPDEAVYYDDPTAPLEPSHLGGGPVPKPYAFSLAGWDACGGWRMSAIECLRLLLALEAKNGTPALLRPDSIAAIRTSQFPTDFYGYGWFTRAACSSGTDSGHGGGSWGSKTWALRSADGAWHTVLFLNSIPTEAFTGTAFEADGYAAVHSLAPTAAPAGADFTWSTLGWDAWQRRYAANGQSGPLEDANHDGVANLVEYGAGLTTADQNAGRAAWLESAPDGTPRLGFRRIILEHKLTWTVETSADGVNWTASQAAPASRTLAADGVLVLTVPLAGASRARLRVQPVDGAAAFVVFDSLELQPIRFTLHPLSQTAAAGSAVTFRASVSSLLPVTLQWMRDGQPIPGATAPTLVFGAVAGTDAGDYSVVARTSAGAETSRPARLVVATPVPGRLVNMSVRGTAGIDGQPLIVGFVVSGGGRKPLLIRAVGPGLLALGLADGCMADPRLDLHQRVNAQDVIAGANDNWSADASDAARLAEVFTAVGAFPLPAASRDAALLTEVDGVRTVHVNNAAAGAPGIVLVEAYDTGSTNSPRLVNVSARNRVTAGDGVLVAGFVITGNKPKRLLIRGVGPGLSTQGVGGVLADPALALHLMGHGQDKVVAVNDNWSDEADVARVGAQVGAFALPANSRDASLVVTVPAGIYTAVVSGRAGSSGEALLEVYDADGFD